MTNQEYLAERIQKLSAEEVYDLLYDILIKEGSRYNSSRAGIAQWLTEESKEHNDSRHAHWIWCADVRCSRCGYKLESTGLPSICPHCGASMNEGVRTKGITYYTAPITAGAQMERSKE